MRQFAQIPLWPIAEDGSCTCRKSGCTDAGKHPKGYWADMGPFENRVPEGWGGGVGILTGHRSELIVVDIDIRPDENKRGDELLVKLVDGREWPDTTIVSTPSGGLHFYFEYVGNDIRNGIGKKGPAGAPGLDVLGEGGYVVAPGSPHRKGGIYEVVSEHTIAPLPEWLIEVLKSRPLAELRNVEDYVPISGPKLASMYSAGVEYCQHEPGAISGQNGHGVTYAVARTLIHKLRLPADLALEIMVEEYNPKCQPAWTERELQHKIRDAIRRAPPAWFYTFGETHVRNR